jgi:thiol-disulfide isomerase/thioredoxin
MKTVMRCMSIGLLTILLFAACDTESSAPKEKVENEFPEWFDLPLTDARTGETFKVDDFKGKVILIESMAIWCPNCIVQAHEVRKLHDLLGNDAGLISISLDVDINETTAELKSYVEDYGFDWYFAVAYLDVARSLGNQYGANYLNPPFSPMVLIDRNGESHKLEFGKKNAKDLLNFVKPFLME